MLKLNITTPDTVVLELTRPILFDDLEFKCLELHFSHIKSMKYTIVKHRYEIENHINDTFVNDTLDVDDFSISILNDIGVTLRTGHGAAQLHKEVMLEDILDQVLAEDGVVYIKTLTFYYDYEPYRTLRLPYRVVDSSLSIKRDDNLALTWYTVKDGGYYIHSREDNDFVYGRDLEVDGYKNILGMDDEDEIDEIITED